MSEDIRFDMINGYASIVEQMKLKEDSVQSTRAQIEEVYQYVSYVNNEKGKWLDLMTHKFKIIMRNI